jgi:hypothetical protein
MVAACVNPANLGGGSGALSAYFPARSGSIAPGGGPAVDWVKGKVLDTPFVAVPGLLSAACVSTPEFNYLSIHINSDPTSPRTGVIPGDVIVDGKILADWGLHLIDANLTMGNLTDIVGAEGEAWMRRRR